VEISSRALEPDEWERAADLAARSLQGAFVGMLGDDPVERLVFFYERYRILSNEGAVVVGAFAGEFLMGMARAVPPDRCVCILPPEIPADATKEQRTAIEAHHAFTKMHHSGEPHWWVGPVGVEPGMQGRGIGTAAMKELNERIGGSGSLVRLEAEDGNVRFYENLGYEPIDRALSPDGTALTFMSLRSSKAGGER
jgi:GNAT superfamily N-acetyltransferase